MIRGKKNMNLTNKLDQSIKEFYQKMMIPAAEKIKERKIDIFPLGPEKNMESYYEKYPENEPYIIEFEVSDISNILKEQWTDDGLIELVSLADPLVELAKQIKVEEKENPDDISPFIYTMF